MICRWPMHHMYTFPLTCPTCNQHAGEKPYKRARKIWRNAKFLLDTFVFVTAMLVLLFIPKE